MTTQASVSDEERNAVVDLISTYARSLDEPNVDAVMQCFTDGASLSYDDGKIVLDGRAETDAFFRRALHGRSTHLLSNHRFGRADSALVVTCSALACVPRDGRIVMRGLVYVFTCVRQDAGMRIRALQHLVQWESYVPYESK